jgi:hypothetical protein
VPALPLQTDAFVLLKRAATEAFQAFTVFSPVHGTLTILQRVSKKTSAQSVVLDLFDDVSLDLESSNQGQTWFVKEARLNSRPANIGRSYETLRLASALSSLVARNTVSEEGRASVGALLRQAFGSFATGARPDLVWFKSLYRFARDEGYPLKEQWFPTLRSSDQEVVATLLNRPLSEQVAPRSEVERLTEHLHNYLRAHTEIFLD